MIVASGFLTLLMTFPNECVMLNDMKMIRVCVYFKLIELQAAADPLYACACVNVRVST